MQKEIIPTEDFAIVGQMFQLLKHKGLKLIIKELMINNMKENQKLILEKSISDNHTTQKEIDNLKKKFNAEDGDVSEIFKHLYDKGVVFDDGNKDSIIYILTTKGSGLYRMKDYVKNRFNINVILPKEAVEHLEKLDNKEKNQPNYIG